MIRSYTYQINMSNLFAFCCNLFEKIFKYMHEIAYIFQHRDPIELDENNEDPITYMDALQRSNSDKQLEAMKFEMESMKVNDVWTLVDPFEGVKFIECKWVFKRKRGADIKEIGRAHV